jgi:putative transposase
MPPLGTDTKGRAGASPPPPDGRKAPGQPLVRGRAGASPPPPRVASRQITPYPRRKHIRIDHDADAEPTAICALTMVTLDRQPVFRDFDLTAACVDLLAERAATSNVTVHAYCFMPDHLHLLLTPDGQMSVIDFLRAFKSLSTRLAGHHGRDGKLWQESFYDHFLRKDEDLQRHIEYILNNPVRQAIVSDWREYPFSGALSYDEAAGAGPPPYLLPGQGM